MTVWAQGLPSGQQVFSTGRTWVQYGAVIECLTFAGPTDPPFVSENPWVVPLPPGDPGDFLLAFVLNSGGATPTSHPPSGWNLGEGGSFSISADNYRTHLYWRQRQAGDTDLTVNFSTGRSGFVTIVNAETDLSGGQLGGNSHADGVDTGTAPNPFDHDAEFGATTMGGEARLMYFQYKGNILQGPAAPWEVAVLNEDTINRCVLYVYRGDPGDTPTNFVFEAASYIELALEFDLAHVCTD